MKETIFISHSAPENNYFAAWLYSKLKLLGFNVWVDIRNLRSGDSFWPKIEEAIRTKTIRFVAVVSREYIQKAKTSQTGVRKEIMCAGVVGKNIENFIVPIRYDNSSYSDFPIDFLELDTIDASRNWGEGLKKLVHQLKESKIPISYSEPNVLKFWFESLNIQANLINRHERHYTNWFPFDIPKFLYIHQPEVFIKKELHAIPFPFITEGNRVLSFYTKESIDQFTHTVHNHKLEIPKLLNINHIDIDDTFTLIEPAKKIVRLLNQTFKFHLRNNGLYGFKQSSKDAFNYPLKDDYKKRVSLKKFGKTGRNIIGRVGNNHWHFAISPYARLDPFPHYVISHHVVFTNKYGGLLDEDKQHGLRRSATTDWYNRDWFERLIAMMVTICENQDEGIIKIPIDYDLTLDIPVLPLELTSPMGYNEPNNEG